MSLETDKRLSQFNMKIPEILKFHLDKLTITQKSELNEKILIVMAEAVHRASFNPMVYLKSNHIDTQ